MVTKEEAKKRIADIAYATLFEAKQHFATYDIMNAFPTIVAVDRKSTRLNSSHMPKSRMPSSA